MRPNLRARNKAILPRFVFQHYNLNHTHPGKQLGNNAKSKIKGTAEGKQTKESQQRQLEQRNKQMSVPKQSLARFKKCVAVYEHFYTIRNENIQKFIFGVVDENMNGKQ